MFSTVCGVVGRPSRNSSLNSYPLKDSFFMVPHHQKQFLDTPVYFFQSKIKHNYCSEMFITQIHIFIDYSNCLLFFHAVTFVWQQKYQTLQMFIWQTLNIYGVATSRNKHRKQ